VIDKLKAFNPFPIMLLSQEQDFKFGRWIHRAIRTKAH